MQERIAIRRIGACIAVGRQEPVAIAVAVMKAATTKTITMKTTAVKTTAMKAAAMKAAAPAANKHHLDRVAPGHRGQRRSRPPSWSQSQPPRQKWEELASQNLLSCRDLGDQLTRTTARGGTPAANPGLDFVHIQPRSGRPWHGPAV